VLLVVSLAVLQAQAHELAAVRAVEACDAAAAYARAARWWRVALQAADRPAARDAAASLASWAVLCHVCARALLGCERAAHELAGGAP